eukprot:scaffold113751_cov34-Tisochrysis_lutea.AAC.1
MSEHSWLPPILGCDRSSPSGVEGKSPSGESSRPSCGGMRASTNVASAGSGSELLASVRTCSLVSLRVHWPTSKCESASEVEEANSSRKPRTATSTDARACAGAVRNGAIDGA